MGSNRSRAELSVYADSLTTRVRSCSSRASIARAQSSLASTSASLSRYTSVLVDPLAGPRPVLQLPQLDFVDTLQPLQFRRKPVMHPSQGI